MADESSLEQTFIGLETNSEKQLRPRTETATPDAPSAQDFPVTQTPPVEIDTSLSVAERDEEISLTSDAANHSAADSSTLALAGTCLGRYQIIRKLGEGGFGAVFLAKDSELDRRVAIKLPHAHRMNNAGFQQVYLAEARTLARLDHPSIVPIYDCGILSDGRCFVVSKYIEGRDLAQLLTSGPLTCVEAAKLIADVAEALHHVHQARIVHRDIKPANLLLGNDGRIYVADFGLALREDPLQPQQPIAGTPNYMSPEQARGEGHRVDGRCDQYSLGVVMYELLTGNRPFSGGSSHEVLHRVLTLNPISPRERNPAVPAELDRICLKLLSKLASQRYETTIELSQELKAWLAQSERSPNAIVADLTQNTTAVFTEVRSADDQHHPTTVVPRGLRAFTRADAYFFSDLLPGARDRFGLPVTLSHWKRFVTERDEDPDLQRVGVISGPTGCGKSSLVRAGLIPALGTNITTIVVEATADLTERQILAAVNRQCSEHEGEALPEALAAIRRGRDLDSGNSLLLIIDQFEQWLHAHPDPLESELVRAIRQCDGLRIQCILLVRDDFWLALSRFMEAVESPVLLGRNAMMIDLFDLQHARKVLIEFGRGFGRLPAHPGVLSRDQDRFVDGAVENLSVDRKIIAVHLALFAEMVRSREWVPSTLRQLGGAAGVGVQFLTESFSAAYAPASQRVHEDAARKILQALLPDPGTKIKASRRARTELMALSGYEDDRPRFSMLMTILESDLKLISATESLDRTKSESNPHSNEQTTYQLSHDFLVPSIREWLTAKQRASRRGRLHQRLSEAASLWSRQRDMRFLPGFWEWLQMRCLLPRKTLSSIERDILSAKDRRSAFGIVCLLGLLSLTGFAWQRFQTHTQVRALIEQLTTADADQTSQIIGELTPFGTAAQQALDAAVKSLPTSSQQRFQLQLARLRWSSEPVEEVFQHVLTSRSPVSVPIAAESLLPYHQELTERCWKLVEEPAAVDGSTQEQVENQRFRAGQLLAKFDPPVSAFATQRWQATSATMADSLLQSCASHPDQYPLLAESMQPAATVLLQPLSKYLGVKTDDSLSRFAVTLLAGYTAPDSRERTRLCLDAADWQENLLIPESHELDSEVLREMVQSALDETSSAVEQRRFARRKAMAAALLLTLPTENPEAVWALMRRSPNLTVRSRLIQLLPKLQIPLQTLTVRLRSENDPGTLCALLLAIGDYGPDHPALTQNDRRYVIEMFRHAPDAGVHSAAEWLLRQWGDVQTISDLRAESQTSDVGKSVQRQWMRTLRGFTLARIPGKSQGNLQHDFLMATHEVTVEQMKQFHPDQYVAIHWAPTPDCPAHVITWPKAAGYCNWLSEQEGLTPFYPSNPELLEQFVATADEFRGPGYRLPTTAEWEFACRAGTGTDRFFGTDPELMQRYAWFAGNSADPESSTTRSSEDTDSPAPQNMTRPTGLLRPNDWGLFDIFGNVEEWCNDPGSSGTSEREIRGGSANATYYTLVTTREGSFPIRIEFNSLGFRVCRTIETD